jgi:tetratricopeptide (TPR) repeat protein
MGPMNFRMGLTIALIVASVFAGGITAARADQVPAVAATTQPTAASLLAQAQTEAAAGHNDTAKQILLQAASLYPTDVQIQKLLGDVEYRLEDYDAAAAAYQKVLASDPNNKDVHNRLGGVYAAQDHYNDAISEFRKSLPLAVGFLNLIEVYDDQGRLSELQDEFEADVAREPTNAIYLVNLGTIYEHEQKFSLAQEEFQSALDNDPNFGDAHNGLGIVYGDLGRWQDAIMQYKLAILEQPKSPHPWMNWGVELIGEGKYDDALQKLQYAINLDPDFAQSYNNMGVAYEYLNQFTPAVESYEKALTLDPRLRQAYQNLGNIYFTHNLLNLAEAAFIKGIAVAPKYAALHFDLGVVYEQQQKYDEAADQYRAALANEPNLTVARDMLAGMQAKLGQHM